MCIKLFNNKHIPIFFNFYPTSKSAFSTLITLSDQQSLNPLTLNAISPHARCIKASFYIPENRLNSYDKDFRTNISMKLVYQYMVIFFNFSPPSNDFHPLQVENCDSNSRLVVEEDDNGKFRPERVKALHQKV